MKIRTEITYVYSYAVTADRYQHDKKHDKKQRDT